jgi:hypothetical protein
VGDRKLCPLADPLLSASLNRTATRWGVTDGNEFYTFPANRLIIAAYPADPVLGVAGDRLCIITHERRIRAGFCFCYTLPVFPYLAPFIAYPKKRVANMTIWRFRIRRVGI